VPDLERVRGAEEEPSESDARHRSPPRSLQLELLPIRRAVEFSKADKPDSSEAGLPSLFRLSGLSGTGRTTAEGGPHQEGEAVL
jgi:hypothetical protein